MSDADATYWGEPNTLERGGSRIHYWVVGPDSGPLVVLTHGATMDHRLFDAQRQPLVDAGYRVLAWDVRGHGYSKPIGTGFSVPLVVEDLCAILDHLEYDEVILVGQSFGGYVSQELLFRSPERVSALCVIGATDITTTPPLLESLALRFSPYLFWLWPDRHLRKTIARYTAETVDAQRYAYSATCQLSKREFITVWTGVADSLHDEPAYRIEKPALLTHGESDRTGTIARDAPAWAAREPNCQYEVIPNAGHNANQDNPTVFNDLLLEFLREHVPVT
ncbi:alpha/beta fold hydrolase [Natronolimnobius baerhuensis]|uniref:Alpha/beta hydrolase n=1 Tax=Natronolimnobius baerhuensis TaxID=253108 RepID=A0A202E828_9EURY|nr:alpha/beta hydrolase [Natronolimnobius baerhuensis]OVE84110.1 alpha/beta hydrolase [Natronolimnobius baerhuensis]